MIVLLIILILRIECLFNFNFFSEMTQSDSMETLATLEFQNTRYHPGHTHKLRKKLSNPARKRLL